MQLYLIRHGIAEDRLKYALKFADDDQRPLTVKGKKKISKLAPRFKELIGALDMIVCSPLVRAQQTAKIILKEYPLVKFKTSKAIVPTAEPMEFIKWLATNIKNKNSRIAIVGHEPHLSVLASWLLFGVDQSRIEIKKGGCLAITIREPVGPSSGILHWAVTPRCL